MPKGVLDKHYFIIPKSIFEHNVRMFEFSGKRLTDLGVVRHMSDIGWPLINGIPEEPVVLSLQPEKSVA